MERGPKLREPLIKNPSSPALPSLFWGDMDTGHGIRRRCQQLDQSSQSTVFLPHDGSLVLVSDPGLSTPAIVWAVPATAFNDADFEGLER